jgi:hypothetical protein
MIQLTPPNGIGADSSFSFIKWGQNRKIEKIRVKSPFAFKVRVRTQKPQN